MNQDNIVTTVGLTKRYGGSTAVDNVDLNIERGVAYGYLGPNGAGKTTLMRMLLGLTTPTAGKMEIRGYELPDHRSEALSRVGAIIEQPRFHSHLTGRQNLETFALVRDEEAVRRIPASLDRVGLGDRGDDKVGKYSLGMKQRLGIARCLLTDPELLILDEPMNGLDPAGILEFRHLIRSFVDEGRTVVISSHLLDEIEKTCDALAIVDKGKIVRQGAMSSLSGAVTGTVLAEVDDVALALTALGSKGLTEGATQISERSLRITPIVGVPTSQLTKTLVEAGVGVESIATERFSLEEEFLSITSHSEEYAL